MRGFFRMALAKATRCFSPAHQSHMPTSHCMNRGPSFLQLNGYTHTHSRKPVVCSVLFNADKFREHPMIMLDKQLLWSHKSPACTLKTAETICPTTNQNMIMETAVLAQEGSLPTLANNMPVGQGLSNIAQLQEFCSHTIRKFLRDR